MTKQILVVDSSPRAGSVSRKLTRQIADRLLGQHPDTRHVHRDLAAAPLPHLTEDVITSFYTRPDQRDARLTEAVALSDAAVDELLASDIIVIGAPMWNFNVPSVLKAWIDHVVRSGRTFAYGPNGPVGLASGRKAIVVLSSGGIYSEGPAQAMDFQTTYLRSLLGFIGITDVSFVRAEGVSVGRDGHEKALTAAEAQMSQILGKAA
ncbi:MAG: FMN-dependent NADH-azoreductase [Alphaproteobacteria bacterium]